MKFDIISIGSAMKDVFILNKDLKYSVKADDPFDPKVIGDKIGVKDIYFDIGGGGSNSAATFSNMGLKTALLSNIGNDLAGKEILKIMKKFKVNTDLVEIDKQEETGYSVIFIDETGDRTALIFRGAADFKRIKNIKPTKLTSKWFFITSLNGNISLLKQIFIAAEKKNIKIAWNPGNAELAKSITVLKPFLKQAEIVLLNFKEAQNLINYKSKPSTKMVWDKNIKNIFDKLTLLAPKTLWCVTGGKKGAWVEERKNIYWANILDKKVVNATGAGDAFGSGFVSGMILYNNDLKQALQLGMLNSNSVVTEMGAKHGLLKKPPTKKMLNKIKVVEL